MLDKYKTASFHYRCERCGGEEFNPHTSERNAFYSLMEIVNGGNTFRNSLMGNAMVTERSLHSCKDGGQGISNLVGYKVIQEQDGESLTSTGGHNDR